MKILGSIEGHSKRYIADVSADELATIIRGASSCERHEEYLKPGTEINVGTHWRRIREASEVQGRLIASAQSLRAMAELLTTIDASIPKAKEEVAP